VREEGGIDPNRDFPYAQRPERCMQSYTARAVNEVWLAHLFQLGLTFHGGMQAIAYEWGSPNHEVCRPVCWWVVMLVLLRLYCFSELPLCCEGSSVCVCMCMCVCTCVHVHARML
jgi:hypothetical protein